MGLWMDSRGTVGSICRRASNISTVGSISRRASNISRIRWGGSRLGKFLVGFFAVRDGAAQVLDFSSIECTSYRVDVLAVKKM